MNNREALSSLAMDLKRIALAYHRGSDKTATRFIVEAKRWAKSVDTKSAPHYIATLLTNLDTTLDNTDKNRAAEDSLMYSTLLQNYALLI